ncbi:KGG domain-containing protein [Hymenobacter chitinivorans]|uniref:Stress-induced acidophilic repeat protein n=1 Tax=Hymenobacter chitinivorans DSM 11115 TaxID=1121954 RepID=A0A2M9BT34_9BACT|nr:KGG domain-containing protein [Hymenobacter chitinivorans]PJJ61120.1 stress-induced acidophilic repeat protein [Hymenobacter chitinivorans DSM 11115]
MITNNSTRSGSSQQSQAGRQGARSTNSKTSPAGKSLRGFAAMDPAEQRRIASEGGKASHESGRGHRFTSEEAREAGRKGGQASRGRSNQGGATR